MKNKNLALLFCSFALLGNLCLASCNILQQSPGSSEQNSESSQKAEDSENSQNSESSQDPDNLDASKVLLISIDGLRPDALTQTDWAEKLQAISSYSMKAQTVFPSVTLPCHMSMFYGVEPQLHGVNNTANNYTPSPNLGSGIIETLYDANKTATMFYDWQKLENLVKSDIPVEKNFVAGNPADGEEWFETSTVTLTDTCIAHLKDSPSDFTFLYYALTDEMGHTYNWMSEKYYWGINHVFTNIDRLLSQLPEDYVVIITSDHGGGGYGGPTTHGSLAPADMTIPFFILGKDIEKGNLLHNVTILDVAPTVVDILNVAPKTNWKGKSLLE